LKSNRKINKKKINLYNRNIYPTEFVKYIQKLRGHINMEHEMKKKIIIRRVVFLILVSILLINIPTASASNDVKLVIDGRNITSSPAPIIRNGRTLVPARLISEEFGAVVLWDGNERSVTIIKDDSTVVLRINSNLVLHRKGDRLSSYIVDVAPQIIGERTFVPLRLVSNILGVSVIWDNLSRAAIIDSQNPTTFIPFFSTRIQNITQGQSISGLTQLQITGNRSQSKGGEIRYLLINPDTGKGVVIARGTNITGPYTWLPELIESGERVIVAAIYDDKGVFIEGDAVVVNLNVIPQIALTGLWEGQNINNTITLRGNFNFTPAFLRYEITNEDTGKVFLSSEIDPWGPYNWTPQMEDNGNIKIRVMAYDHLGKPYSSQSITAKVEIARRVELRGVSSGATVTRPVNLSVSRNFQISSIEYILRDPQTGQEEILAQVGNASFRWFPTVNQKGSKVLFARVRDNSGTSFISNSINISVTGNPILFLEGVGPGQVVTGSLNLRVVSNTSIESIQYVLINTKTGNRRILGGGREFTWTPIQGDAGDWRLQAEGTLSTGAKITSEGISFRVFLGKTYSARPIIERAKFMDFASELAVTSWQSTGMSAALQTAQAILETGWGQSVPVDKYSGKFSFNLFGIKGTGPAGSVISNTWEEYNGQIFRIDANFRAYSNVNQSWDDHKRLLLTSARYEPFRIVMHNSTQGAWALRRAGYATDSQYPIKLMNIIRIHNLRRLDEVSF
jgi:hypothetical protein